jgi:hypothetical protein
LRTGMRTATFDSYLNDARKEMCNPYNRIISKRLAQEKIFKFLVYLVIRILHLSVLFCRV